MRKAIISPNGTVENVIVLNEGIDWPLPEGYRLIDADDGSPGDKWNGTEFVKPVAPVSPPNLKAEWDAAKTVEDKLAVLAKKAGF